MDFLKIGLKSVLGTPEPGDQLSGAETVERLVDRLTSSTLLDDRRDACRALKSLSRKYRIEVGAQGMPALIQILEMDRADSEIIGYAMGTLCNITSQEEFDEEADNPTVSVNVGEQFTEMFIKSPENVTKILDYLAEFDFKIRWPAIKFLTCMILNKPKEIQEIVLISPMAVSKLIDLLSDSREIIRNDALLLLVQLTRGNANIQKIVAFENAFDRLFDIIRDEGCSDGGIVVEDCLILMLNLIKNNTSNQQFFKEGSYIQRLAPMFTLPPELEEHGWTPQRIANINFMLQIVRALVCPSNTQLIITSCQKAMRTCGLIESLCNILMGSGVPANILTETINTVGEAVRGDITNQEYLNSVMAPSNPPRPAIVVLLMSMVNEKQPLPLRCAVLYCFQCFLYRNEVGQSNLVQTLLPSTAEISALTAGQLLCGGLFSTDALANWFSAVSLMHGLIENPAQKERLLNVLLATSVGGQPISLLQQCTTLLQQSNYKIQSKIGLLMLLATWLGHCQLCVKNFLTTPGSISYLIAQIGANEHDDNEYLVQGLCAFLMGICIQFNDNSVTNYQRDDLCQLLVKRIGLETFNKKLGEVSKHESYSKSAKQPQIRVETSTQLLLDYEFCKLFKALEAVIIKIINGIGNENNLTELTLSSEASGLVGQYKDIIREQDFKLQELQNTIYRLDSEKQNLTSQLIESQLTNSQLFDQNILLKAQLTAATSSSSSTMTVIGQANGTNPKQIYQNGIANNSPADTNNNNNNNNQNNIINESTKISFYESENKRLLDEIDSLNTKLNEALEMTEQSLNLTEMTRLKKDQDNLLELLTDQESKLSKYKELIKSLGHTVSEDDESDEEEDDEDDDDDEDDLIKIK